MYDNYVWIFVLLSFDISYCSDDVWSSFQRNVQKTNREELVVTKVKSEEHFIFNSKVKQWKSLTVGPVCYTVGYSDSNITVLVSTVNLASNGFRIYNFSTDVGRTPTDIELLGIRINGTTKTVVIASFSESPQIIWYWMKKNDLETFWSWPLEDKEVILMKVFKIGGQHTISFTYQDNNETVLSLYGFDLRAKGMKLDRWLMHSVVLDEAPDSIAFNHLGDEYYISVPQTKSNFVQVYTLSKHVLHPYKRIPSNNVQSVVSFEIIFKSFIAVDGQSAGIFEFMDRDIVRRNVSNSNLHGIHYWLPVPVDTLRDEVILFAQREIDHGTHKSFGVEIITYNGVKFEEHEDVPCHHFGMTINWLDCLSGIGGMLGSSYIVVGDLIGLIVPRLQEKKASIFTVDTTIRKIDNPKKRDMEYYKKLRRELEKNIHESEFHLSEVRKYKSVQENRSKLRYENVLGSIKPRNVSHYTQILQELSKEVKAVVSKVKEISDKENNSYYETITIFGPAVFQGPANFSEAELKIMNEEPATNLLEDIVRRDNISERLFNKTFSNLEADEVNFEKVNGIRATEIIYDNDTSPTINGNLVFEMPVEAENVFSMIEQRSSSHEPLSGAQKEKEIISEDVIHFPANVSVDFINGINFTEFTRGLCLVDVKCYIPGKVIINGNVSVTNAETFKLNGLKFPNDYLFDDDDAHANITGHKTFTNTLSVNEVNLQGRIDGMDPQEMVTLSTDQDIPAKLTFSTLHVTKKLNVLRLTETTFALLSLQEPAPVIEVTGRILDEHENMFSQNPTLINSNILKSNVNFREIEIDGNVIVDDHFNGASFKETLEDIVYQDMPEVTISAMKRFPKPVTVQDQLTITTESINGVNLQSLVTKDTRQDLNLNRLNGDVTIRNLVVFGNYDGKNVTKLDEELVKLTGDQYVASTLIFMDELVVDDLNIKRLNDIPPEEYFYTTGVNNVGTSMGFEEIQVANLVVEENVIGVSSDNGLLDSLEGKYLSITKNQIIENDYFINLSNIEDISVETMNEINSDFSSPRKFAKLIKEYLNQGILQVEDLYFAESVKVSNINNRTTHDFAHTQLSHLKGAQSNLSIEGNVYFDDLDIVLFGNTNWSSIVDDFVFKNNSDFNVKGLKIFTDEFSVEKLIQTEKLNSIFLDDILTKQGDQELKGDILIKGNVTFNDLMLEDDQDIFSKLLVENGTFIIIGDMLFSRIPHIQNLTFDGLINGKSLETEIRRMVSIDNPTELKMLVVFESPVKILGNVEVKERINNIFLSDALSKLVLIGENSSISSTVVFTHPVLINESLTIDHNLVTQKLSGYVLDDWRDRAILLDRGYLPGNYTFEEVIVNDDLVTEKMNNISKEKIIPLISNQSIDELHFIEAVIINDITVVNTVSGRNLSEELENTFMVDSDQTITSMIFENNVLIRKNLNTSSLNNKPAGKIVTTNTDQELTANYDFKTKTTAQGDLKVHGLLNEINTQKWKDNLLKVSGAARQQISRPFDVAQNVSFEENVDGDGLVAGLDLVKLVEEVEEIKKNKVEVDRGVIDDYNNICTDIKYLTGMTGSQIYKFKYFEDWQEMAFGHLIRHTFYFEYNNSNYLLVNEDNFTTIETGDISQTITVRDGDKALYLVTNNQQLEKSGKCSNNGTNVWQFEEGKLELMFKMEDVVRLQDSLIPNTFYGLGLDGVSEFVIRPLLKSYRPVRRWVFISENAMFLPRGLRTGLTLYTEKKLIHLNRMNSSEEVSDDDDDFQTILRGSLRETPNKFISKQMNGTMITTTVGTRNSRETLLVVTEMDDMRATDFINIFSNPIEGDLFQRIPADKPSSMLSLDFGQGQTLLVFLEDETVLQVYEYKGIEGFQWKNSAQVPGSQLFLMSIPILSQTETTKAIGVIDGNKIKIIRSVMVGARFKDEEKCHLNL